MRWAGLTRDHPGVRHVLRTGKEATVRTERADSRLCHGQRWQTRAHGLSPFAPPARAANPAANRAGPEEGAGNGCWKSRAGATSLKGQRPSQRLRMQAKDEGAETFEPREDGSRQPGRNAPLQGPHRRRDGQRRCRPPSSHQFKRRRRPRDRGKAESWGGEGRRRRVGEGHQGHRCHRGPSW